MRIVIDGACGSGKTTFLKGTTNCVSLPSIEKLGYTVFSDLLGYSFSCANKQGIIPPRNFKEWNILFEIILNKGSEQFNQGCGDDIYWYDRGIPYIKVISDTEKIDLYTNIQNEYKEFKYDYAFIFHPIEEFDLSNTLKGGLRTFTLEDRYISFEKTCEVYSNVCNNVYTVPVFSDNYETNFLKRYEYINEIINRHNNRG